MDIDTAQQHIRNVLKMHCERQGDTITMVCFSCGDHMTITGCDGLIGFHCAAECGAVDYTRWWRGDRTVTSGAFSPHDLEPEDTSEIANIELAIAYAKNGTPVFPLLPSGGIPAQGCRNKACGTRNGTKHSARECPCRATGTEWFCHAWESATTDLHQIGSHWALHPEHGVSIATGAARLICLDIDLREGDRRPTDLYKILAGRPEFFEDYPVENLEAIEDGLSAFDSLAMAWGAPVSAYDPDSFGTLVVATPGGGLHVWYRLPEGVEPVSCPDIAWHVEIKSALSSLTAPGTETTRGIYDPVSQITTMGIAPAWLMKMIEQAQRRQAERKAPDESTVYPDMPGPADNQSAAAANHLTAICAQLARSVSGRHDLLLRTSRLIGGYIGSGLLDHETTASVMCQAIRSSGYASASIETTVSSGLTHGAASPLLPDVEWTDLGTEFDNDTTQAEEPVMAKAKTENTVIIEAPEIPMEDTVTTEVDTTTGEITEETAVEETAVEETAVVSVEEDDPFGDMDGAEDDDEDELDLSDELADSERIAAKFVKKYARVKADLDGVDEAKKLSLVIKNKTWQLGIMVSDLQGGMDAEMIFAAFMEDVRATCARFSKRLSPGAEKFLSSMEGHYRESIEKANEDYEDRQAKEEARIQAWINEKEGRVSGS